LGRAERTGLLPPHRRRREGPAVRLRRILGRLAGHEVRRACSAQQLIIPLGTNPTGSAAALLRLGPPLLGGSRTRGTGNTIDPKALLYL